MSRLPLTSARLRTPGQRHQPGAETEAPTVPEAPATAETPPAAKEAKRQRKQKPLKERGKQMIVYINPQAHTQLKLLAAKEGRQINDLAIEAFNLLFRNRQLPQNAEPE